MTVPAEKAGVRSWWRSARSFTLAELIADGIVHGLGITLALGLGTVLIVFAAMGFARPELPAIVVYVTSLVVLLAVSMIFNLAPISTFKRFMARLDQAAIFLLIAGTYTPFLAIMGGSSTATLMMIAVWAAALIGVALKLFVPEHFGRLALVLYLGIGWSGVIIFQGLAELLPPVSLWLLLAGGLTYSAGIVFHLWERMKFHNVVWHIFVVAGASCHLWSIYYALVLSRI